MYRNMMSVNLLILALIAPSAQSAPAGLIMWNKLGSDTEVANSAFGPGLSFYTGGSWVHVDGQHTYVPGQFGQAVTLTGIYFNMARVHNLVLNNLDDYIDPEQGTIEVWYYQKANPVPYNYGVYRIFDGAYGLGPGMGFYVIGESSQLTFSLAFGATNEQIGYDLANIPNHQWIHLAAVWDRQGIEGSADTMRLYVNGVSVAAGTGGDWGTTVGP